MVREPQVGTISGSKERAANVTYPIQVDVVDVVPRLQFVTVGIHGGHQVNARGIEEGLDGRVRRITFAQVLEKVVVRKKRRKGLTAKKEKSQQKM